MHAQLPPPPRQGGAQTRPMLTEAQARGLVERFVDGSGTEASLDALLGDYKTLRLILDRSAAGIAVFGPDLRYVYINDTLARANGVSADDHVGHTVRDMVPHLDHTRRDAALREVLRDGRPQVITLTGRTATDPATEQRWWINAYNRLEDESGAVLGVAAVVFDVTYTYRVRELLNAARNRLALLDEAATRISATLDADQICRELARLMVPRLADFAAVDVLELDGPAHALSDQTGLRLRRVALTTTPRLAAAGAAERLGAVGETIAPQTSSAVTQCLVEQRAVVSNRFSESELAAAAVMVPSRVEHCRDLGLHSAVYVPLTVRRNLVGVLILGRAGDSPSFAPQDVDLAEDLARRAATGINHARRFAQEHQTALLLQQALLARPRPPHPDVECASRYLPTGADIEIGGDWYDTVALPGGKTLLVVGDVMGHGFEAAAAMSEYRSLLRTLALQGDEPAEILAEADRIAQGLDFDRVATCIVAVLDPVAHTCTMSSAGHLPPLLVQPDGSASLLGIPADPPLGVGGGEYSRTTIAFPPGAILLCYTDGLVERRDRDIEECLAELTKLDLDPTQPLEHLVDHVLRHFDPASWEDDVAVLCARLRTTEARCG